MLARERVWAKAQIAGIGRHHLPFQQTLVNAAEMLHRQITIVDAQPARRPAPRETARR